MKKLKGLTLITLLFTLIFQVGCFSVNNNYVEREYPSVVYLQVSSDNGTDFSWLRTLISDFEQLHQEDRYHDGNKGVDLRLEIVDKINLERVPFFDVHMYMDDSGTYQDLSRLISQKSLVKISDVVNAPADGESTVKISDMILDEYKPLLTDQKGDYYALPCASERQGVIYDSKVFQKYGLYLADPQKATDQNSVLYSCKYGKAIFIREYDSQAPVTTYKACGNDGIFGTMDDGLPTSLEELFVLCDYMRSQGVNPFTYTAQSPRDKEYLYNALYASLSGREGYQTQYTFNGEIDVVTGFSQTQNAFDGIDYVKQPITKKTTITEDNGYLANSNVNRYWGMSLLKIINDEGWYSPLCKDTSLTETQTIERFLLNGMNIDGLLNPTCGMFITTDRWYNKSVHSGSIKRYHLYTDRIGTGELTVRWMPLPTRIKGTVTPNADGEPNATFTHCGLAGNMFLNERMSHDIGGMQICKEFIKYIFTERGLSTYTAKQGFTRTAMNYTVQEHYLMELNPYQISAMQCFLGEDRVISPIITNLYNTDVDYYYDYDKGIDGYLGQIINSNSSMSLYQLFDYSTTTLKEWEIFKSGGKLEYDRPEEDQKPEQGGVSSIPSVS